MEIYCTRPNCPRPVNVFSDLDGAQVLMLAANTGTLDKALQVVLVNRKRLKLLGGDDVYTPKTLEIGADEAVGMIVGVPWHIDADPKSDFSQQSRKLWGADVNWRTALAYDAVRSLIAALQFNPTRTGIQQTLSSSNFSTTAASGIVRFLPSGAVFPPFITAGIRSSSAAWFQSRTNCRCD